MLCRFSVPLLLISDPEPISCSSACDIEQPPLGLVYVFKLHLVPGGLDALPRTASFPERSEVPR